MCVKHYFVFSQHRWCDVPELQSWRPLVFCRLWSEGSAGTSEKCPSLDPPEGRHVNRIRVSKQDTVIGTCEHLSFVTCTENVSSWICVELLFFDCQALKAIKTHLVQGFKTEKFSVSKTALLSHFNLSASHSLLLPSATDVLHILFFWIIRAVRKGIMLDVNSCIEAFWWITDM